MSTDPDNAASPDLVARLVQLDEELAARSATGAGSTAAPDATLPDDLADEAACLEVFERVREHAPGAVDDLLNEEPLELTWLETEDGQPQRLGRFAIQRRLGSGGFGVVFLAHDPDLDREVALKVPRVEALVSDDLQQRFFREARAAASLNHANIAAVYEVGRAGPICYISSAVCQGGTLRELLEQTGGRLPSRSAAMLVAALAEAVQHAHNRGILHRDIKPGNVLLDLESGDDLETALAGDPQRLAAVARLVDFGLARDLESADHRTRTGVPLGTPAYMAPEQAAGDRDRVGAGADVYALGATLYHLLTGQPPIKKESDLQTLQAVAIEQPKSLRRLNPTVPVDLDAICLKCLEKNPDRRYPAASALADDLHRFLDGQPVRARPVSSVTRLTRWCGRNPALAASLGLLLAVLTAGVVTSSALWIQADAARRDAESKETLADEKAAEALRHARHSREAVDSLLAGIADEPLIRSEGMEKFRQRLLESASKYYQEVQAENPQDPEVLKEYISTLRGLARMHGLFGDHLQAIKIWDSAADLAQQLPQGSTIAVASVWADKAGDLMTLGRFDEAIALTDQAVERVRNADASEDSEKLQRALIKMLVAAADVLQNNGEPRRAEKIIDQALDGGRELTNKPPLEWPSDIELAKVIRSKATVCMALSQDQALVDFAAAAIRMFEEIQHRDPSQSVICLESIASMHKMLGVRWLRKRDYSAAEREYRLERDFIEQLARRHPDIGGLVSKLANNAYRIALVIRDDGRLDEARPFIQNQLEWLAERQDEYPDLKPLLQQTEIYSRHLLSTIHRRQGREEQRIEELNAAILVCEEICAGPQQPLHMIGTLGNLYSDVASAYLHENQLELAVETFQRALSAIEPVVERAPASEAGAYLLITYANYAGALNKLGRHEEALEYANRILAVSDAAPAVAGSARRMRIRSLVHLGEYQTAMDEYGKASGYGGHDQKSSLTWARCASQSAAIAQGMEDNAKAAASADYFVDAGIDLLQRTAEMGGLTGDELLQELNASEDFAALRAHPQFVPIVNHTE